MEQNTVKYFIYTILLNHLDMPIRELLLFPFYRLHKIIFRNCNTSIEAQAYKPRCYRALRCLIIASYVFMILSITLCNIYKAIFYKGIKVSRTVKGTQKKFLKC